MECGGILDLDVIGGLAGIASGTASTAGAVVAAVAAAAGNFDADATLHMIKPKTAASTTAPATATATISARLLLSVAQRNNSK